VLKYNQKVFRILLPKSLDKNAFLSYNNSKKLKKQGRRVIMINQENKEAIRKVDELGRVIIPKSIREALNIKQGQEMGIFVDEGLGIVVLKPIKN